MEAIDRDSAQVFRSIARGVGSPVGNIALPLISAITALGIFLPAFVFDYDAQAFQMHWLLKVAIFSFGSIGLTMAMVPFQLEANGKKILSDIEKNYGPQTGEHVFRVFASGDEVSAIDLDIPAIARAYGEANG